MLVVLVIVVVLMLMLMLMFMFMFIMAMMLFVLHVLGVFTLQLHRLDPSGALHDFAVVKVVGRKNLRDVDLAVGGLDDFCLGLQRLDNSQNVCLFFVGHFIYLVQDNGGAVFDLLNQQVLDILLVEIVLQKVRAGAEFIRHSLGVDDRGDAVEIRHRREIRLSVRAVQHADRAGDRTRLADT